MATGLIVVFVIVAVVYVFLDGFLPYAPDWIAGPPGAPRWRKLLAYAMHAFLVIVFLYVIYFTQFRK